MTQKVLKVGSSAAVTIPKKSMEELGIKIGDEIIVEVDSAKKTMLIKPNDSISNEKVRKWTKDFIKRYRPALEALAKK